ncbi:MAG TPA: PH domain-containing protein [Arenimonas sp.]|jgi:membrane protein YdbS with pleckstrin-like domain|nr:PH domain-containing protein [Arenimonas sp.]
MTDTVPAGATPAPLQEDIWQPLPAAAGLVASLGGVLAGLGPGIALAVMTGIGGPGGFWLRLGLGALALLLPPLLFALVFRQRARRVRWRLDAQGLAVRRGLFWHSEILVPRSRVQHLDVERGPVERQFGLATLIVHTAGTRMHALRQAGFDDGVAMALRDALVPEARRHDDAL